MSVPGSVLLKVRYHGSFRGPPDTDGGTRLDWLQVQAEKGSANAHQALRASALCARLAARPLSLSRRWLRFQEKRDRERGFPVAFTG